MYIPWYRSEPNDKTVPITEGLVTVRKTFLFLTFVKQTTLRICFYSV